MWKIIDEDGKNIKEKMKCLHDVFCDEIRDDNPNLEELVRLRPTWCASPTAIIQRVTWDDKKYIWGANWWGVSDMQEEIERRIGKNTFSKILKKYEKKISAKNIFWLDNIFLDAEYRKQWIWKIVYYSMETEAIEKWFTHMLVDTKTEKKWLIKRYINLWFQKIDDFICNGENFTLLIKKI
ncbi:MAG: hypothetical protein ACD_80C00146G0010 [uncultured bacterium (gcode 4)]|uniref:Uncharacterized protein n=1 Tax=uncultured bacterium (gcode 4) TaxID=1234023 RepID=K1X428_9BACT|nr:MAG: hypothetical protein ACD_80C00146G0010 [uncultured bacterium (gcode 4)]